MCNAKMAKPYQEKEKAPNDILQGFKPRTLVQASTFFYQMSYMVHGPFLVALFKPPL